MKTALPEIDDRVLAMADGDWMDLHTAADVLASWFARPFAAGEVAEIVGRLSHDGLVRRRQPLAVEEGGVQHGQAQAENLEFTATAAGSDYLRATTG